jgi:hypothetical protein
LSLRDLADFALAGLAPQSRRDQLEVVNGDERDPVVADHAGRLVAQGLHGQHAAVVDVERGVRNLGHTPSEAAPVVVGHLAAAHDVLGHARFR